MYYELQIKNLNRNTVAITCIIVCMHAYLHAYHICQDTRLVVRGMPLLYLQEEQSRDCQAYVAL